MRRKKKRLNKAATFLFTLAVCLIAAAVIFAAFKLRQKPPIQTAASRYVSSSHVVKTVAGGTLSASALKKLLAPGGLLMLVNKTNKVSSGYTPDFVTIPDSYYVSTDKDTRFDRRAAPYLEKLIDAGRAAGCELVVYSGYRTYAYQQSNFDRHVKEYEADGMKYAQAAAKTAELVAPPGTSEHETGLACDIVSKDYIKAHPSDLTADIFDKYPSFRWLMNNCAKYGFILRYLKDKVNVTKYGYESWHFRFVGVSDAGKIMKSGLCLEEYVAKLKKAE